MRGSSKRQGKAGSPLRTTPFKHKNGPISVLRKASRLLRRLTWLSREFMVEVQ